MTAFDNLIQPFFLGSGALRGVLVRAGRAAGDTVRGHGYPASVGKLLAESLTLGVALSAPLKYEGLFTLQIRGDGPVRALVVDVTSSGMVRGVARFDPEALPESEDPTLRELTGRGLLTFTVDQGAHTEPYQGIVRLDAETVTECALSYIAQSEQIPTLLSLSTEAPENEADDWRAGALLLQRMPGDGNETNDAWETATALMNTLTAGELTDPKLSPEELLWRLFHEEEVRISDVRPLFYGCRCSPDKVLRTLASLPEDDRLAFTEMGVIDVVCDFCQTHHTFTPKDLADYISSLPGDQT